MVVSCSVPFLKRPISAVVPLCLVCDPMPIFHPVIPKTDSWDSAEKSRLYSVAAVMKSVSNCSSLCARVDYCCCCKAKSLLLPMGSRPFYALPNPRLPLGQAGWINSLSMVSFFAIPLPIDWIASWPNLFIDLFRAFISHLSLTIRGIGGSH